MSKRKSTSQKCRTCKRSLGKLSSGSNELEHDLPQGLTANINLTEKVDDADKSWKLWGPYLSERHWATVREDKSADGSCWEFCSHEHSRKRHYRQGEDGLLGVCDNQCLLCLGPALWNGVDNILKERMFGVTGPQGNHGEDVKECYYYLRSDPKHMYMEALYKYPMKCFPYVELVEENGRRTRHEPEYELTDTGVFDNNEYWDVHVTIAKNSPRDILTVYTVHNRSSKKATIHVLPSVWFRNTWPDEEANCSGASGSKRRKTTRSTDLNKPSITSDGSNRVLCSHPLLGEYYFAVNVPSNASIQWLFTENESEQEESKSNDKKPAKSDFHEYVINSEHAQMEAKNGANTRVSGTKCAAHCKLTVPPNSSAAIQARLFHCEESPGSRFHFGQQFDAIVNKRKRELYAFYKQILPKELSPADKEIALQAFAGLCWSKQFYCFRGSEVLQEPIVRNHAWSHMVNSDIILMPDKWEFPWYATWDLAFHTVPYALIDPAFARDQLLLLLSERYMHPNGQLPAYEFNFSDTNPPVHAWACFQVYNTAVRKSPDVADIFFLKQCFHKLLLNFSWWVNSVSVDGSQLYAGGFLGLDNISCVDRSNLPADVTLLQADGTAWMAFFSRCMLQIALELALVDRSYEDMAVKFLDHFTLIASALNGDALHQGLWDEVDEFYYDTMREKGVSKVIRVRSLVGLVSLFSAHRLDMKRYDQLKAFRQKLDWILANRPYQARQITSNLVQEKLDACVKIIKHEASDSYLLTVPSVDQLRVLLKSMCDSEEFLSDFGIRSLSKFHKDHPFSLNKKRASENSAELKHRKSSIQLLRSSEPVDSKTSSGSSSAANNNSSGDSKSDVSFQEDGEKSEDKSSCDEDKSLVHYCSGESTSDMFGGNSNWRGPVWVAMNYLIVEALDSYHSFLGDKFLTEHPLGSGSRMNLKDVGTDLLKRVISIFQANDNNARPCHGTNGLYADDPFWKELLQFHEFFDAETGRGCGASHQTGWTALVTSMMIKLSARK